nr:PEPxxWA-CTERM sorting domain-containing protein [Sandaracinobacteroides hominis]
MRLRHLAAFAAASLLSVAAQAGVFITAGNTSGEPTWNRTTAGNPPTTLSPVGTAVPYEVTAITVDFTGIYGFSSVALYDNFLHLYVGSFDPSNQFANLLVANDDAPVIGTSGFFQSLTAGLTYYVVASGFANYDAGGYLLTVAGRGNISEVVPGVVPEPAAWAMLIVGFGAVGLAARRRREAATA